MTENNWDHLFVPIATKCWASLTDVDGDGLSSLLCARPGPNGSADPSLLALETVYP